MRAYKKHYENENMILRRALHETALKLLDAEVRAQSLTRAAMKNRMPVVIEGSSNRVK
jgi:hypothetical protein